jgi:hypothetical protein
MYLASNALAGFIPRDVDGLERDARKGRSRSMPNAEHDICKDPRREDWVRAKYAFEAFAGAYDLKALKGKAEKLDEEESATRTWFYQESLVAIRTIDRTLNDEIAHDEAIQVVQASYQKIIAAASRSSRYRDQRFVALGEAVEYLAENLAASKVPNSPRLVYLQIAHYLEKAESGFSSLEEQNAYWGLLSESHRLEMRKQIKVLIGDRAAIKYEEKLEEVHECIYGGILIAREAAVAVTGCIAYERAERLHKHLRKVLNKVQLLYCRLLCLVRNFGVGIQAGVTDNIRVSVIAVARYLEVAFRCFESIQVAEEDCTADLITAWASITQQVSYLKAEIVRFTSGQATAFSATWQSSIVSLTGYSQEATSLLSVKSGMTVYASRKRVLRIMELTNLFNDELMRVNCLFVNQRFRYEVFDVMWALLIQIRCALLCSCRERKEEAGLHENQVKWFFETFEFLKASYASAQKEKATQETLDWSSSATQAPPAGSTGSSAQLGMATPSDLAGLWNNAVVLIGSSQALSKRFAENATVWLEAAKAEKQLFLAETSPGNTPASILQDRTLRVWRNIYGQMSVALAVEKDASVGKVRQDLDQFSTDLSALNAQIFLALGQPLSTTVPAAAGVGATS